MLAADFDKKFLWSVIIIQAKTKYCLHKIFFALELAKNEQQDTTSSGFEFFGLNRLGFLGRACCLLLKVFYPLPGCPLATFLHLPSSSVSRLTSTHNAT